MSTGLSGLDDGDHFGEAVTGIGDLDGDMVVDFAVGIPLDDGGGTDRGAVRIVLMNADGTVKSSTKINSTQGGFTGELSDVDQFGSSVAAIGDLDGDMVVDLAVGAPKDDDGGTNRGAVWILFLNPDGSVKAHQKISSLEGGFGGTIEDFDTFGNAVARAGDLDLDGTYELAIGAEQSDDGGQDTGSVWVLFLNTDGTVAMESEISSQGGGFGAILDPLDRFGSAIAPLGDIDGDGVADLVVGADADDDGGNNRGALYVLLMNDDGSVDDYEKVSTFTADFDGGLGDGDRFGSSLAALGDLEGDGTIEVAAGAPFADAAGIDRGQVWIVSIDFEGEVDLTRLIGEGSSGFTGPLADGDAFGSAVTALGDLDGDGVQDLLIGSPRDDNAAGNDIGAVWIAFLGNFPSVSFYNGSGVNLYCLLPINTPVLGRSWDLAVSTFLKPGATSSFVVAFDQPLSGVVLSAGELLIDPLSNIVFVTSGSSGPLFDYHSVFVTNDPALLGRKLYAQAGIFTPGSLSLCNGIEFTAGR